MGTQCHESLVRLASLLSVIMMKRRGGGGCSQLTRFSGRRCNPTRLLFTSSQKPVRTRYAQFAAKTIRVSELSVCWAMPARNKGLPGYVNYSFWQYGNDGGLSPGNPLGWFARTRTPPHSGLCLMCLRCAPIQWLHDVGEMDDRGASSVTNPPWKPSVARAHINATGEQEGQRPAALGRGCNARAILGCQAHGR